MRLVSALFLVSILGCTHAPARALETSTALPEKTGSTPTLEAQSACRPSTTVKLEPVPLTELTRIRADDSVTLERTACFGKCPEYSVTLRGDGVVSAKGERNVASAGGQWTIDAELARRVLAELVRADVFSKKASLTAAISDLPGAVLTVKIGERQARIDHRGGGSELETGLAGPDNAVLARLEQLVDVATEADTRVVGCPVER